MNDELKEQLDIMAKKAWLVRENAYLIGKTSVGCAVLSKSGNIYVGCNVEHKFRCHDVHAEVNAITNMIAAGDTELIAIVIAAQRDRFTPCGSCMDWIFPFGGDFCWVAYQSEPNGELKAFQAGELMPYYPK